MTTPNDNSVRKDYTLGNRITGWARQAPKKYTPNLAKRQHILSDADGRYSSVLTATIKPATQQFPAPALNIQMSNGNGSAFQRIGGLDELQALGHQISLWADELKTIWSAAVIQGVELNNIQKEVEQRASMFSELMSQMKDEPQQFDGVPQEWESNN